MHMHVTDDDARARAVRFLLIATTMHIDQQLADIDDATAPLHRLTCDS